jgi:transcriptional regulator with GAF, ATPase, and Fis domain
MADEKKTQQYIVASEHTVVGRTGGPSDTLAPGERVLVDPEAASHKFLVAQLEAGDPAYSHLSLVDVSYEDEAKQNQEREEQLAKAAKIAAEAREEELKQAQEAQQEQEDLQNQRYEDGAPSATEGTDFPPVDEEAISLAKQSGAASRASTQEDAVEESPKRGRRSGRS